MSKGKLEMGGARTGRSKGRERMVFLKEDYIMQVPLLPSRSSPSKQHYYIALQTIQVAKWQCAYEWKYRETQEELNLKYKFDKFNKME